MRRFTTLLCAGACLTVAAVGRPVARGGEAPPSEVLFRREGPFLVGYASVPWSAAYSPDGRWLAIVEGYLRPYVAVYDARTRAAVWRQTPVPQPASYRPVFTRDGDRLVLVEGQDLVIRKREDDGWVVARRSALGLSPGVGTIVHPIALSADEKEAALIADGRVLRLSLAGAPAAPVDAGVGDAVSAAFVREGRLRIARWSDTVATTVFVGGSSPGPDALPFAVLAASPDEATWLVARRVRGKVAPVLPLELVDAGRQETLASLALGAVPPSDWVSLNQVEFTPDGRHLVTVEGLRTGLLREARTGKVVQRITEYEGDRMIGFAISPDGRSLVTGGRRAEPDFRDQAVLLWRRRE